MGLVSLSSLRIQSKQRADMVKSKFIPDSEWDELLNLSAAELYDLMVATAEDYYTVSTTVSVTGSEDQVNLPADFYKLIGVDYLVGGMPTPMERFMFRDRLNYQYQGNTLVRYRTVKNTLFFTPRPAAQTFTIWYVPLFAPLVADSDTLDGFNGFEEYVIVTTAIKALVKEESDPSALMAEQAKLKQRIIDMAPNRDQGAPERVTDVLGPSRLPNYLSGFFDGI